MTQLSYYWDGIVTGDAVEAPYTPSQYHSNWKILFTEGDNQGYLDDYLNELLPSLNGQQVVVASGAAVINGWYYENTENVQFDIDTPAVNPRIDRIVLRLNTTDQQARLAKLVGTEAVNPTAPTITQGFPVWEIPIAQVLITTSAVLALTDEREKARSPMLPQEGIVKIAELESDGSFNKFIFDDIPQIYTNLFVEVYIRSAETTGVLRMQINDGDEDVNWQQVVGDNAVISATASAADAGYNAGSIPDALDTANFYAQIEFHIANYKSSFWKFIISNNFSPKTDVAGNFELFTRGGVIQDANPITKIILFQTDDADKFATGSIASLYGMF